MTRKKHTMDHGHFKDMVRQSRLLGATEISVFGYGEPLLDTNLWRKLCLCGGLKTNLTTNASLLDNDILLFHNR